MELTTQQIQHIDHRLENEGVKYWDIRLEMLDHIVLDVENHLKPENTEYEFKEIVQQSFEKLGWKENFNGGGFDKVYLEKLKHTNNKSQREIRKEFIAEVKKTQTIIYFLLFFIYLFIIKNNTILVKYTAFSMIIIVLISFFGFIFNYKKVKSTKFNALLLFASLPLSIFNLFMFFPETFFGYEKLASSYTALSLSFTFPFLVIIIKLLYQEIKLAQKTYNNLIE
jgi:hypothetical protein